MKNEDVYNEMVESVKGIERKGKNNPYTSVNGHMFSFLDKEGYISIRFSKTDLEKFKKEYRAKPSIQYGSVMRGYALVPKKLYKDIPLLSKFLKRSYKYVSSLEPKPSKKKKK